MFKQGVQPRWNALCLEGVGILMGILALHGGKAHAAEVGQVLAILASRLFLCGRHCDNVGKEGRMYYILKQDCNSRREDDVLIDIIFYTSLPGKMDVGEG